MKYFYTIGQIKFPCVHNFAKCISGTRVNQIENKYIVSSFQFVISDSVKSDVYKTFARKEMDDAGNRRKEYF